ncbi:DEAD/DEAH box helicase [Candidatus Pacearchaeota archaeon]|nr:MAG: DEAD/DEAH box helicase [Candidatus Pacearchaeota archaeon]
MKEINLNPRSYQRAIFQTCVKKNCLVVLPTGTGKTLIAAMVAVERFKKFPIEKVLILAPTRPLIEQHFESFKKLLPDNWADMQLFTGKTPSSRRKKIWQSAEFVFSTPQCIANDLRKGFYNLEDVCLLVIDECHRCTKNYAYSYISGEYRKSARHQRIVGLTASPGSDKEKIQEVCNNLGIEAVEVRTRRSPDVLPYLKELEFEKIEVSFPLEFIEIRALLEEIVKEKIQELRNGNFLKGPANKVLLLKLQSRLFEELRRTRDGRRMRAVSACAVALKILHAIELLETQTLSSFVAYLREIFQQASEKKSRGVQKLARDKRFSKAYTLALSCGIEHPKLGKICELVRKRFDEKKDSRVIVFAQFRETVRKIARLLNKIEGVSAEIFVGQAIKQHGDEVTGLKQKEQKELIEKFREGTVNVLVATSIAEEGLDIPEVSEVIFYEPVPSAIRKIQRAGRTARLFPGSLKILVTKNTRDQAYHYSAYRKEKRMLRNIHRLEEGFKEKDKQERLFE